MNSTARDILFALLRSVICGVYLSEKEKQLINKESLQEVIDLSKKHDILNIVAFGLKNNALTDIIDDFNIDNEIIKSFYRYEQLKYELDDLCDFFENEKIAFMPLKGPILREYYPEPWMRTSSDIDILVHKDDLEKAIKLLTEKKGYRYKCIGSHDAQLYLNNIHLELHFCLLENGDKNKYYDLLKNVWQYSLLKEEKQYWYLMTNEMFYFYIVTHLAEHLKNGGCGVKQVIDLWLLNNQLNADKEEINKLLEQGHLLKFSEVASALCRVFFEEDTHSNITLQMEHYILQGGVYGTIKNKIAVQQVKKGGRFKYICSRIFVSYEELKLHYTFLSKYKFLTPIMQPCRWCKLVLHRKTRRVMNEIKISSKISTQDVLKTREFLSNIGL